MKKVVHEIMINCEPESAFLLCTEVEKWPDIFPPCRKTKVIERSDNHIVFEITAETEPGKVASWVSKRSIDRENKKIEFIQTRVAEPLKSMEGTWLFEKCGDMSKVSLVHVYSAEEQHYEFIEKILDKNSKSELKAIKEYIEK